MKTAPAAEQPKTIARKEPAPLPSFVPADTLDSSYAAANPGWERYRSNDREFKIFRENGDIKALQVIAANGSGIPSGFFTSVLKEMAKVSDYKLESKEKRDGFIIKKGRLSPTIQVIIYKDRADKILNAFVIHFQGQEATPPVAKEKP
jgi:flagellar FliL protein